MSFVAGLVVVASMHLACRSERPDTPGVLEEIALSQPELQARVAPKFPVSVRRSVVTLNLANPKVMLPEGADRIGIELDVNVTIPLLAPIAGKAAVTGALRYDASSRSFFLQDASLDKLDVGGLKPEHTELVRKAVETLARATLENFPIYRLNHNFQEAVAAAILKKAVVRDGALRLSLGLP